MAGDAERRTQSHLESVLNIYNIDWNYTRLRKHPAVELRFNGRRLFYPYAPSGDFRSALNAKTGLRRMLEKFDAPLRDPAAVVAVDRPSEEDIILMSEAKEIDMQGDEWQRDEADIAGLPIDEAPAAEQEAPASFPPAPELPTEKLNQNGYTIYQSALVPNDVIAIKLERDLVAYAGSMLIIPLHNPNAMVDVTSEVFAALFRPKPVAAPPAVQQKPEIPIAKPAVSAAPVHPKPAPPAPPASKAVLPQASYPDVSVATHRGLGGQVYRILAALFAASKEGTSQLRRRSPSGSPYLTIRNCGEYMADRDRKQYASRMPKLVAAGLVHRGPALEPSGFFYAITNDGQETVKTLGPWPWLRDGMTLPTWINKIG